MMHPYLLTLHNADTDTEATYQIQLSAETAQLFDTLPDDELLVELFINGANLPPRRRSLTISDIEPLTRIDLSQTYFHAYYSPNKGKLTMKPLSPCVCQKCNEETYFVPLTPSPLAQSEAL
jgi:hypothetical protein